MSSLSRAIVLAGEPGWDVEVCGIGLLERLLRTLQRAGLTRVTILTPDRAGLAAFLARPSWARAELALDLVERPAGAVGVKQLLDALGEGETGALVVEAARLFDARLVVALRDAPGTATLVDPARGAEAPCGLSRIERAWLAARHGTLAAELERGLAAGEVQRVDVALQPTYLEPLRRQLRPLWSAAPREEAGRLALERQVIDAAQKHVLEIPALLHAPIENELVRRLCRLSITPNQVSLFGTAVAWTATALFATGRLEAGVLLALAVGVIDGVDGKLARVKVETTPLGKLEHKLDGLFELSWLFAIAWHLGAPLGLVLFLAAEGVNGLAKLLCLRRFAHELDDMSPLDRAVRLIAARRNVDVWMFAVAVAAGRPAAGFQAILVWEWATALWHLGRSAWLVARKGAS